MDTVQQKQRSLQRLSTPIYLVLFSVHSSFHIPLTIDNWQLTTDMKDFLYSSYQRGRRKKYASKALYWFAFVALFLYAQLQLSMTRFQDANTAATTTTATTSSSAIATDGPLKRESDNNEMIMISCPMSPPLTKNTTSNNLWLKLTRMDCLQRYQEVQQKLLTEQEIMQEMIQWAQQRAKIDPHHRTRPHRVRTYFQRHYESVQSAVVSYDRSDHSDTPVQQSPYAPWKNFSYNSFAHLSILGFPKAGTSQLFQLLSTHPHAAPLFKRKEFCIDHGHFLDYTDLSQYNNLVDQNDTLFKLQRKLWRYHKHALAKRSSLPTVISRMVANRFPDDFNLSRLNINSWNNSGLR